VSQHAADASTRLPSVPVRLQEFVASAILEPQRHVISRLIYESSVLHEKSGPRFSESMRPRQACANGLHRFQAAYAGATGRLHQIAVQIQTKCATISSGLLAQSSGPFGHQSALLCVLDVEALFRSSLPCQNFD
jgi:hypothetical protein